MEKEELQELFRIKIGLEKERFKRRMLKQEPEEIFAGAYQIDTMISIYELLLEMSHEIGDETLKKLIVFPNLMAFLYRGWLKKEDTHTEELQNAILETITGFMENYKNLDKEDKERKAA